MRIFLSAQDFNKKKKFRNVLRAFEELKDSFASVDQLYTLIEKTLVDVFKTRIHPAVGDGPLIDLVSGTSKCLNK